MRKIGTTSSFISSKELEEEVSGGKDVKVDKNLRESWKSSREPGMGDKQGATGAVSICLGGQAEPHTQGPGYVRSW